MVRVSFLVPSLFGVVAAGALLAGCGGAQSPGSPLASAAQYAPSVASRVQLPDVKGHCTAHGGVRVDPCSVDFASPSPAPDTVTVRVPKDKKGKLTESDTCGGASGMATIAAGTGNQWTVTAGSTSGSCTATFDYTNARGKRVLGSATLSVTNSL